MRVSVSQWQERQCARALVVQVGAYAENNKAMKQVRPSLIVCVPLILEKIYRKLIVPMNPVVPDV